MPINNKGLFTVMQYYRDRNNLTFPGMESWRGSLSDKKVEWLEKSWAGVFRMYILPNLPAHRLADRYSDHMGRPSKDLITCMGAILLQQIFDLTDERTQKQLAFNQEWHYALDTFEQEQQLLSLKTLWSVRQAMTEKGLDEEIFKDVTGRFADVFNVDTRFQRLDSVHIHSNMARLGRVRLLSSTVTKFLKNLKRQHRALYESMISGELSARYLKEQSSGYFGNVKPSEAKQRMCEIAGDLYWLKETFAEYASIRELYSYKLLGRVFHEQCCVEGDEVLVIPAREVGSDSLQNPSDPDAGYDGHKGQGYQVQLQETFTPDQSKPEGNEGLKTEEDDKEPVLNLITHVAVEPAHVHDSAALEPALEDLEERSLTPEELLADAAYGSDENVGKAGSHSVELLAPVPGRKGEKKFDGFEFDDATQEITVCPGGQSPICIRTNRRKGSMTAFWDVSTCRDCSLRKNGKCPVKEGRRGYYWQYLARDVRVYRRRMAEDEKVFRSKYRYRAGIEGTNSRYVHMTGARRLRYRGLERVRFAGVTKALGINLFRTAKYVVEIGKLPEGRVLLALKWVLNCAISAFRAIRRVFCEIAVENPVYGRSVAVLL